MYSSIVMHIQLLFPLAVSKKNMVSGNVDYLISIIVLYTVKITGNTGNTNLPEIYIGDTKSRNWYWKEGR